MAWTSQSADLLGGRISRGGCHRGTSAGVDVIAGVTVKQTGAVGHHPMSNIKSLPGGFVRHWALAAACRERLFTSPVPDEDRPAIHTTKARRPRRSYATLVIRDVGFRLRTPHNAALWWLPCRRIGSLT